ncbi:MAG: cation diffusion facilitator family transporter [Candidatus Calescibacterium sp.]|nr:cation diffusion facilitator family transporter [Candidatus Calescibacterium sp.]MDW8086644.1 cation diffusion facilitator family transporter [Candidatus Calescibacterium sp.]
MLLVPIIVFYLAVVFFKIFWGITGKNLSLLADGLDSVKNVVTLVIAFFFSRISRKGVDETHHFGHTKYDSLGAVVISIFQIFVSGITMTVVFFKFGQIPEEKSVDHSFFSFILMFFVVFGVYFASKRYRSESIRAEFWHEFSDLIQTGFVLISTYISVNYFPLVNSIFALFVSLFLLCSGIRTFLRVEKFIMDWAPPPSVISAVKEIVSKHKNVLLRENRLSISAENKVRVELTIQLEGNIFLQEAHNISHIIEKDIKDKLKDIGFEVENIVIHVEPSGAHIVN